MMKLELMKVLSQAEIQAIHDATLDILANTGVKILDRGVLDFLAGKGLSVDAGASLVRMSRSCVEEALALAPQQFGVYDRNGHQAFSLGDRVSKVAAGHNAVFWSDSETGQTRSSTVADVELFARICDALAHIDMIGIPVMPQDVPDARATLLYGVRACIRNSTKPIFFSTDKPEVNRACIDLLRAAYAGDLSSEPYGISQLSPTSPLFWEGSVLEALRDTVEMGVPLAVLPEPNAGVSAPLTLAGLITLDNAECLSGIVIAQLLRPRAKVLYANSWTTTDMRTGAALVGSIETSVCRIAGTQMGQFYRLPTHTTAPNSDNHAHDEQNSWEKTFSQLAAIASGTDLVVNCGMFATGMTCSHEQLVMDEEISAMCRRLVDGLLVNEETLAADVIQEIGPQGPTYLTHEQTLKWLRSPEYIVPRLAVRGSHALWQSAGSRDTSGLAKEQVAKLAAHAPRPLEDHRAAAMDRIVEQFSAG